jgi:alanine racemase
VQNSFRCWAEVDLDALRENLAWLRHRAGPAVKIITVVKADAYGHGLRQIAALLMQSGTDVFGVANLTEARAIRSVGRGWPVLMLGACLPGEREAAVREEVMVTVSSAAEARAYSAVARRLKKTAHLHVKLDTGMGRLGIGVARARALCRLIARLPQVRLAGLYTHFAAAEDEAVFTRRQQSQFEGVVRGLLRDGFRFEFLHASNSAGVLHQPGGGCNAIRPGLLVYGILPPGRRRQRTLLAGQLRPALSWKCRVSLVKRVSAGTSLSYGRTFITPRAMRVAIVTAGYGDGYLRAGSNRARVLIGGRRCRVLGRVTMDQMIVDVTGVPRVRAGDEVVLIGQQGRGRITANDLAAWFGTVPWEVLTAIGHRVPRVYRGGQAA